MAARRYANPAAFRRGLTDKLKGVARDSKWTLPQLQRQIAYDRLLERLYAVDEGWVVKGATALLARDLGVRASIDVDVFRAAALEIAERELREAIAHDLDDWFVFEVGPAQEAGDGAAGLRVPVRALIGPTEWAAFHVDLVGNEVTMTGAPEQMPALARVTMPDIEQHGYRVYPLVDHIADKIAATFDRYGKSRSPSTRYKDLVDLVAIASAAAVEAEGQIAALRSEAERRSIELPTAFAVPSREVWKRGYEAEAARSLLEVALTLEEALELMARFADPLLNGSARGAWDPSAATWTLN
ncbi:MAG TPA: nucleotidyl transferase AbiEii/AbiGii toxin family protein [Solirubrobacterales bacterium]